MSHPVMFPPLPTTPLCSAIVTSERYLSKDSSIHIFPTSSCGVSVRVPGARSRSRV